MFSTFVVEAIIKQRKGCSPSGLNIDRNVSRALAPIKLFNSIHLYY